MEERIFSGKYQIQREIARGGMGTIYHAIDLALRREVAIKVLHAHYSGDPSFAERFLREARGMARLDHPNIVRIYSVEEEEGAHYIVMEYFLGRDLKDILREHGPLPPQKVVHYAIEITKALAYAHHKRIVHRDIKPGNILVGEQDNIKITDFGIAAALDESSPTVTGTIMGTPQYMSPEQARGDPADFGSDLYSLGIVLYEMLTGQNPYQGMASASIVGKLAYDPSALDLVFPPGVTQSLQGLIRGLTTKDSGERKKDSTSVLENLKDLQDKPESSLSTEAGVDPTIAVPPPLQELPPSPGAIPSALEGKAEIPSQPPSLGSDILPSKKRLQFGTGPFSNRVLSLGLTGLLFLVGLVILLLNTLPPTGKQGEEGGEAPREGVQEKSQQGRELIQSLERLQLAYANEYTKQQKEMQAIGGKIDDLQVQVKKIQLQAVEVRSGQEMESAHEGLVNLRKEVKTEKARQLKAVGALSRKAQEALKQIDTASLGEIEKSQLDRIQNARTEVLAAQNKIQEQQGTLQQTEEDKLAGVTAALAEMKEAFEAVKRREAEAVANANAQKEREAAERLRQITAAISKLEGLNRELQEAQSQQQTTVQSLLGQTESLLTSIHSISPSADPKHGQQQLEMAEQRVADLRQQIGEERARQETSAQARSERVTATLTEAARVLEGKLNEAQQRSLKEIPDGIKAAHQQLAEQQASFSRNSDAKLSTLTAALSNAKETVVEAKRREAEALAKVRSEKEKKEAERRKQVSAVISKLEGLDRELQTVQSEQQTTTQTLLGQTDTLLATIQRIVPSVDPDGSQLQIEAAEQRATDLKQQIGKELTRQEATASTRSEQVMEALTDVTRVLKGNLEDSQRRSLNELPESIKAAQQLLAEQQVSFTKDSSNKLIALNRALDQKKEAMREVQRQHQEAEAKRLAAIEAAKKKEEEERQHREKKQQLVAMQRRELEKKLERFRSAYENHDLVTLQQTTSMEGSRVTQVKLMFNAYPVIEIVSEIQTITDEGASAKILITKLIDQEGKSITPSPIIRETIVKIRKEGDGWGKIQW